MIDEAEFSRLADAELARIESALEACGADLDVDRPADGVLEVEFADGSKLIVNRHLAAREIWVAAPSGGFHFKPQDERWVGTRDGRDLYAALESLIGERAGTVIRLAG